MATLHRTTVAAEELALHLPVVIAIVKPGVEDIPVHHFYFISTFELKIEQENEDSRQD